MRWSLRIQALHRSAALDLGAGTIAWQIEGDRWTDVAILRGDKAAEALALPGGQVLETDAELVVLRMEDERPFALMARGTRVLVDGSVRVEASAASGIEVEE